MIRVCFIDGGTYGCALWRCMPAWCAGSHTRRRHDATVTFTVLAGPCPIDGRAKARDKQPLACLLAILRCVITSMHAGARRPPLEGCATSHTHRTRWTVSVVRGPAHGALPWGVRKQWHHCRYMHASMEAHARICNCLPGTRKLAEGCTQQVAQVLTGRWHPCGERLADIMHPVSHCACMHACMWAGTSSHPQVRAQVRPAVPAGIIVHLHTKADTKAEPRLPAQTAPPAWLLCPWPCLVGARAPCQGDAEGPSAALRHNHAMGWGEQPCIYVQIDAIESETKNFQ